MTTLRPTDLGIGRLFERVHDAIVAADCETGRIVLWNPGAARIFGYTAAEVNGQPIEIIIPPSLRAAHEAGFSRYRATGRGHYVESQIPLDLPALTKAGDEIRIEMTLSPIDGADGRPYVLAIIRDVTDRKRAEVALHALNADLDRRVAERTAQLEAATSELQAAVQVRDEFLSVAAHELKTPLTSLRGSSQLLLRSFAKGARFDLDALKRRLGVIDAQSVRLSALVNQLLDVSRLDAGRLLLNRSRTDLLALVQGVVTLAQAHTEVHQIRVRGDTIVAAVDPLRIEQVITNLVDNAVKYSPEGGPIELTMGRTGTDAVIAVADRGIGVPPAHRGRIFDRFHQAHSGEHYGGMGLGLYISRQIVELHGGTLTAEFPPDGGTRFIMRLPLSP